MKEIEIYTDGSCRGNPDGPGGYGAVLKFKKSDGTVAIKELSQGYLKTTNNRMELLGVIKGLEALTDPCRVNIYTDSKYIVNAFNEGWLDNWIKNNWKRGKKKDPVKNKDLWIQLLAAKEGHQVIFNWVKGHAGHAENERCDELATLAADEGPHIMDDNKEIDDDKNLGQMKL